MQVTKNVNGGSTLAFKPRADITRGTTRRTRDPRKWIHVLQKIIVEKIHPFRHVCSAFTRRD